MKPARLRPAAQRDVLDEVRFHRLEACFAVARRLCDALRAELARLEHTPALGSPRLGHELGVPGLRTWPVRGFPLSFWCFERDDALDVARLVGQRQDPEGFAADVAR